MTPEARGRRLVCSGRRSEASETLRHRLAAQCALLGLSRRAEDELLRGPGWAMGRSVGAAVGGPRVPAVGAERAGRYEQGGEDAAQGSSAGDV